MTSVCGRCVQFDQNTSSWSEQDCRCLDAPKCQWCNCSIPRIQMVVQESVQTGEVNSSEFTTLTVTKEVEGFQPFVAIAVRRRAGCTVVVEGEVLARALIALTLTLP